MSRVDVNLTDHVHSAINESPFLPRRNLRCEAHDGRVTLRGVVDSYYQKQMAQEVLRRVDGVNQIDNELEVCWGEPVAAGY